MPAQIENLTDYPALKKLAEALWRQNSKKFGAAIMVGAGFSRCSASHAGGPKKMPLWHDFARKLAYELDGGDKDLVKADPVRLAEEYRAYFGPAALNDFIKSEIDNDAWSPGVLHANLLSLPWSEVLTTNWDTLLERAALDVHTRVYSVVAKQTDLSVARSPRIAKLHGSIGVTDKLIFAQEDYRRYPKEFAAFVNFARQTFIENELCLIGYSGDDPNFLQWAGWVRDNLAEHSRRIYLVGALKLTASKRKWLEANNIAPIDLWEAVKDNDDNDAKHVRATELFIETLLGLKPKASHNWEPSTLMQQLNGQDQGIQNPDPKHEALILEGQIDTLQVDRKNYTGWIVCPVSLRWSVQTQIWSLNLSQQNFACMKLEMQAKLLYEIAWRHSITFERLAQWLAIEISKIADPGTACAISKKQQLDLALFLLKIARFNKNQQEFKKWSDVIVSHIQSLKDGAAELAYQKALMARDNLDYKSIESEIEAIQGEDPIWKLRKASLLAEVGNFEASKREVSEAYSTLRRRSRQDPNSIWVQSRLAWAHWFFQIVTHLDEGSEFIETLAEKFRSTRCDPWEYITYIRKRISRQQEKYFESQQKIEPLFHEGHYRDRSNDISFSSELPAIFVLEGIAEVVGLPFMWENVDLFSTDVEHLVTTDKQAESAYFHLAIRAASSASSIALKRVFSRIILAKTPTELVDDLVYRVISAIEYWRKRVKSSKQEWNLYAIQRVRVFVEVLARLSIRLSDDRAMEVFKMAMEMGHDNALRPDLFYEVLGNLISCSLTSIPRTRHSELLLKALDFPLQSEIVGAPHGWPNPIIDAHFDRVNDLAFDHAVSRLIDSARIGCNSSTPSLRRLLPLIRNNILRPDELNRLASVLWGANPDYKTLPSVDLYLLPALLTLPAPDRQEANSAIARRFFEVAVDSPVTRADLIALAEVSQLKSTPLFPDGNQAMLWFERIVAARPNISVSNQYEFPFQKMYWVPHIGRALCHSVLPALPSSEITEQRFDQLMAFYTEAHVLSVVTALPFFARVNDRIKKQVAAEIRKGMRGHSIQKTAWSASALYQWVNLASDGKAPLPPDNLFIQFGNLIESKLDGGLVALLWTAGDLLAKDWLPNSVVMILEECLPEIFHSVDYNNIESSSDVAEIWASPIRVQCVRLSMELCKKLPEQNLIDLIEIAKSDPLPEVRFATQPQQI